MELKKLVSLIIAAAMIISAAVPVFADEDKNIAAAEESVEKSVEKETKDEEKAAEAEDKISVKINGADVDFSQYDNVLPYIENDFTLVPIRAIAEGLGLEVSWNGDEEKVTISGKVKISLVINSSAAEVDGESKELDIPARIVNDRTFVPLRFISENMGAKVEWHEDTRLITIDEETPDESIDTEGEQDMNTGGKWKGVSVGMKGDRQPKVETDPEIIAVIEAGADKFEQLTFKDEESDITLEYSLYIPENYDESESYPMIMFIPDASAASKSAKEIVEQYYGADIWVTEEEQAKHKAFVLVPAFSEIVVDDDWNTSEEIETAVKLINYLTENYSIDTDRLYTTGQSMGCMTSLYLNGKYPDLFAASLFVSGQWDVNQLNSLTENKFFYITAGGDAGASGGQEAVKEMLTAAGISLSYGEWSAQNSVEEQNASAQALIDQGYNANMIRFEAGSVLNGESGMEHNASFNYGYKIPAVRDWLFAQSK